MTSDLTALTGLVICGYAFAALGRLVRDPRPTTRAGRRAGGVTKLSLIALIASQLGLILAPVWSDGWWLVFDVAVAVGLVVFFHRYYARFADVKISGAELLKVSEDHYSAVAPGCRARIYRPGTAARFPFEGPLVEAVEAAAPPSESQVIFHVTQPGKGYPEHGKPKDELVRLSQGAAELRPGTMIGPGVNYRIPAHWRHFYTARGLTIGVSIEYPPGVEVDAPIPIPIPNPVEAPKPSGPGDQP